MRFLSAVLSVTLIAFSISAQAMETVAKQVFMIDATTGTVLFQKNADEKMPPSSMSKVMTAYMVFDQLKQGRMKLDDVLPVSQRAWKSEGSRMFIKVGDMVKIEDLLRGLIIQSGNDAAVALAEGVAGSEEEFADRATQKAHAWGLNDTSFVNATGLPNPDHYTTAHDLAVIAQHLIKDFPEHYHYYSELDFTYNNIKQGNRNPLLYRNMGADGMKTGHTDAAGYGLIASVQRNGRRILMVVNGLPSMQARADESARLIEWGFREFDTYSLFKAGETIEEADVWLGKDVKVPLVAASDVAITMPRKSRKDMVVKMTYTTPLAAPVTKGTVVGKLLITAPEVPDVEVPVQAGADVKKLGFFGRVSSAVSYLLWGPIKK